MNAHYSSTYKLILLKKYFFSIVRRINEISLNLLLWPLPTVPGTAVQEPVTCISRGHSSKLREISFTRLTIEKKYFFNKINLYVLE